jgi:YggT family protein
MPGSHTSTSALVARLWDHYTSGRFAIGESAPMIELLNFINTLITLYVYIIIAGAVMSWLIAFNVVNPYNQFVRSIWQGLNALTEPLLRPIRRWMPDLGGIDISPVVLIIACWFIQGVVLPNLAKLFV